MIDIPLPPPQPRPCQLVRLALIWAICETLATLTICLMIQAILMAAYSEALGFGLISAASQTLIIQSGSPTED